MAAPADAKCTCSVCTRIRVTIDQIFRVLDVYGWLLNSYVVDFFQEDLWERLPESWRLVLQDTRPQEFGKWLSGDISCTRVWPLSLLALRQTTNILQLNRNYEDPKSVLSCVNRGRLKEEREGTPSNLQSVYKKFENLFSRRVKKKKRLEIEEIARICADHARESDTNCIVDVGAGMGHLARALAFKYGLCVACVEQDSTLLRQASKCDHEFLSTIRKHWPTFNGKSPQHVVAKLESSNLAEMELVNQLQRVFKENFDLKEAGAKFGLVGLHPCGDLAPILLKFYTSRTEAKFICIVGCCYMKLTPNCDTGGFDGYPLSNYLSLLEHSELSYNALEVACHAIEKYCDKLTTGNYEDLIVHTYRAALETILIKRNPELRRIHVKNVKVTQGMTFQQYCTAATYHLETYLHPQTSDVNSYEIQHFLSCWQKVIIFGSLRTMLAPLVETIVLLDRFLFLSEQNFAPILKPAFDARLSPRNLVLVSSKAN